MNQENYNKALSFSIFLVIIIFGIEIERNKQSMKEVKASFEAIYRDENGKLRSAFDIQEADKDPIKIEFVLKDDHQESLQALFKKVFTSFLNEVGASRVDVEKCDPGFLNCVYSFPDETERVEKGELPD